MYICMYICMLVRNQGPLAGDADAGRAGAGGARYTRSPLEDSRLFGPSPWKILATTYEQKDF